MWLHDLMGVGGGHRELSRNDLWIPGLGCMTRTLYIWDRNLWREKKTSVELSTWPKINDLNHSAMYAPCNFEKRGLYQCSRCRVRVVVLNATFITISVISWRSVLLLEETAVLRENFQSVASHWQNLITLCCIECTSQWAGFKLTTLVVIGTDCIGSCKSNYHTITTTTAPV